MRRFLIAPICFVLTVTGCTLTHPLGEGYESLGAADKDERALEALHELFAFGVNHAGGRTPDRDVASCTSQSIVYASAGVSSTLRWRDVESVETRTHEDLPARPETLQLFLAQGSPSTFTVKDTVQPTLMSTGLVRSYVELYSRPRWSANRLRAALKRVDRAQEQEPLTQRRKDAETQRSSSDPESKSASQSSSGPGSELDAIEEKLRRLKQWRDDGLIGDEEYEQKRQELLKGL